MIIVTSWATPGQPKQDVEQIREAVRFAVNPAGALELVGDYGIIIRAYAPGKWIEAKKQ